MKAVTVECGTVTAVTGSDVMVEAPAGDQCSHCAMGDSCAMGAKGKVRTLRMHNGIGASVGERVEFSIHENTLYVASVLLYLFPVLMLMGGAVLGSSQEIPGLDRDLSAALAGFAGFLLSLLVIRWVSLRLKKSRTFVPVLLSVIPREEEKKQ